jgi:hypothetical protein
VKSLHFVAGGGWNSMPYWSRAIALAGVEEARTSVRAIAGVGALPEGFAGCPGTSRPAGFCQWVIVRSGPRQSTMLITNWLSWAGSSGVSTARGAGST